MSEPGSVLDAQVNALGEVVESSRDARCRELLDDARRGAEATVKRAHRDSRARMRATIEEQRIGMQESLAATRARLATRARQRRQELDREYLGRAWVRLGEVLHERWQDVDARRRWILGLVEVALARLPGEPWQIEHSRSFDPAELAGLGKRVAEHCGGEPPAFVVHESIEAGLRIVAGGARIDGTAEGLLTDKHRVEAELLAVLRAEHAEGPPA